MVDALSRKSALLIEDKQMSRTFRRKVGSNKIIKDGDKQYAASSCRHHGGCDYCKNNRTFEKAISLEDELELLSQDVLEDSLQELTDEDLFVLSVQDFLCSRRSDKKSEPIDTSGTFEDFHERMVALQKQRREENKRKTTQEYKDKLAEGFNKVIEAKTEQEV